MEGDLFARVEPEFRHIAPKAIELLDKCRMTFPEATPPDKILPVAASLDASVEVDDGPKHSAAAR